MRIMTSNNAYTNGLVRPRCIVYSLYTVFYYWMDRYKKKVMKSANRARRAFCVLLLISQKCTSL